MTDKEMLDWVEANVTMLTQLEDDNLGMSYKDVDGKYPVAVVIGPSLRDCIRKANPVKNLEGDKLFLHKGIAMKAVQSNYASCDGCPLYTVGDLCSDANNSLESAHGHGCGMEYQIHFVNKSDEEAFFANQH